MPTLDITDDHADRIEALREELEAAHAGPYASVDREDAFAYLLDLADAVDDPDRLAAPASDESGDDPAEPTDAVASAVPFERDRARELLTERNRRDSDPDPGDPMDLSDIAAAFDITGRSEMTKDELVGAILDAAEELAADPFARVDVDLDGGSEAAGDGEDTSADDSDGDEAVDDVDDDESATGDESDGDDGGAGQLNAMMSLLDTHDDKWREADGDARYEVDLPDGSVETARTKDDVRALLFRNY
ncbi:MAG: hypothetical protein ACQERM_10235 [Methanobacteriota archaeon]